MKINSIDEIAIALKEIGDLQQKKISLNAEANLELSEYQAKITSIQEKFANRVNPLDEQIADLATAITAYANKNRKALLGKDEKNKSRKFSTGTIGYRKNPDSVTTKMTQKYLKTILDKNNLTTAYDNFCKKLTKIFLKVKIELDKTTILQEKNQAKAKSLINVEIADDSETFYIKPNLADIDFEMEFPVETKKAA
jgi:phage host-nuclease inhibitor protein Gam